MLRLGEVRLTVYPVGQGLFSTLLYMPMIHRALCRCGPFSLIYDCGAGESGKVTSSLERSIIHFSNNKVSEDPVNVLVISHLHWDHVAGLPLLLSLVDVDEVLMPYLTPCERLLSLITEPPPYRRWYLQFIADPVSFLMDFGVRRITLIGKGPTEPPPWYGRGGEGEMDGPPENKMDERWAVAPLDEKGKVNEERRVPIEKMKDRYKELQQEDLLFRRIEERSASEVYFMERASALMGYCDQDDRHGQIVALVPFLIKENVQFNEERLKDLLKNCGISNFGQAIQGGAPDFCLSSSQILSLLKRKECISKLKKLYEDILGKRHLNEHSLVINVEFHDLDKQRKKLSMLFSHPECIHSDYSLPFNFNMNRRLLAQGAGFLFTGDFSHQEEKKRDEYFNRLLHHYGNVIKGLSFYQVPHHGSINGWSNEINDLRSIISAVSYGTTNRYGHPDPYHMMNVCIRSNYLIKINEKSKMFTSIWTVYKI